MNFYFRQYWNDPRLSFDRAGIDTLSFGHEFTKSIWMPDTFFVNEKQGFAHSITAKNEFIKVQKSGNVIRSIRYYLFLSHPSKVILIFCYIRLSVTASCLMDFRRFPMDTQTCPLSIESC